MLKLIKKTQNWNTILKSFGQCMLLHWATWFLDFLQRLVFSKVKSLALYQSQTTRRLHALPSIDKNRYHFRNIDFRSRHEETGKKTSKRNNTDLNYILVKNCTYGISWTEYGSWKRVPNIKLCHHVVITIKFHIWRAPVSNPNAKTSYPYSVQSQVSSVTSSKLWSCNLN